MRVKLFYCILFAGFLFSCKSPEARRPVQTHSGTFIKESAARNKKIYDEEKNFIEQRIKKDTANDYISS